ncbi:hypothetical protein TNCT_406511 [Trichonephila clavata]|uniref:Uncharacterized protein n=1 Tax=Trichonephila clavata TaxID=2740835 RepID=A0A8X6K9E8_TRICU|nr:hypothetical protein TNCT_406511 [Trichonephila clavata]
MIKRILKDLTIKSVENDEEDTKLMFDCIVEGCKGQKEEERGQGYLELQTIRTETQFKSYQGTLSGYGSQVVMVTNSSSAKAKFIPVHQPAHRLSFVKPAVNIHNEEYLEL